MSDLTLAPPPDRSPLRYVLIAAVVLAAIAAAIFYFNPHKTAEITVSKVDIFSPHTVFKATPGAVHIIGVPQAAEDDVYVIVHVSFTNKLRIPIFLDGTSAILTSADGTTLDATSVAPRDLPRLETTFPNLAALANHPLTDGEISPGAVNEGAVVLLFPGITQASWHTKKLATLTFNLAQQSPQTVPLP